MSKIIKKVSSVSRVKSKLPFIIQTFNKYLYVSFMCCFGVIVLHLASPAGTCAVTRGTSAEQKGSTALYSQYYFHAYTATEHD